MKALWVVATLCVLGPLYGMAGTVYGTIGSFKVISESSETNAELLAEYIYFALYATVIGFGLLLIGVALHIFVARKTGDYRYKTWASILIMSILACFTAGGFVIGVPVIILLFTLPVFKRMRDHTIQPA